MTVSPTADDDRQEKARWRAVIVKYQQPSTARATLADRQHVRALRPALVRRCTYVKEISLWLTIPLAILAGALLVRVFIIFHDCGHGSFFKSRWANDIVGFIAGVLTFTPYYHWRWEHAIHHGTAGHLDKRGIGDVWTMTVQEYLEASRWKRFSYRLARNPFVLFVIAPVFIFLFRQRFASSNASPRERHSVWWMNLALLCLAVADELDLRPRAVPVHPDRRVDGGGRHRHLAVLRAAPVRRRVLGARRATGTTPRPRCRAARTTSCRASCNGSRATSASTTSTT